MNKVIIQDQSNHNKRIEFIDAMRGFTMILVVIAHVSGFCFGIESDIPSIHPYLYEFRMPTFFFISGFVLYKTSQLWNLRNVCLFIKKKFPIQIITTAIFFLVFLYTKEISFVDGLYSESKNGYWFTYVLFIYFIVYSTSQFIFHSLHLSDTIKDILILGIGIGFYMLFSCRTIYYSLPIDAEIESILSMRYWGYYLFFTIGILFRKHHKKTEYFLDDKPAIIVCLIIFFISNIFYSVFVSSHVTLFNLLTAITGIILIFSFFRQNQNVFTKDNIIGRHLQYIGRRTLDIYLLHYFLLPTNLFHLTSFLRDYPMPLVEFCISLSISLIIISACLLISKILRMSPTAAYLLFGVKNKK